MNWFGSANLTPPALSMTSAELQYHKTAEFLLRANALSIYKSDVYYQEH